MDLIRKFVEQVIEKSDYTELDKYYLYNHVLHLVGKCEKECQEASIIDVKDALVEQAVLNQKIDDLSSSKDSLGCELMDLITPIPSVLNQRFNEMYAQDKKRAIADFYELSKSNDYVKTKAIAKNIYFKTPTDYGNLEITINLSKPEKDPTLIALLKKQKDSVYPRCALCFENEGFRGTAQNAARGNHRMIPISLCGEDWFMQYSPYVYYNEHCIVLNRQHVPMKIDGSTFRRLLDFTEQFPHYFMGSNSDLPIVGGSIMAHDHFQGGRFTFPMELAPDDFTFEVKGYPDITCSAIKWPLSVIRIRGCDRARLAQLAEHILAVWRGYSDESVEILAESDGEPHNTITPIARRRGVEYELDLALRNNRTSAEHPFGIFHPHTEYHHIKKENIGLIEVMGLAVLPPRLKNEIGIIRDCLLGDREAFYSDEAMDKHCDWYRSLCERDDINEDTVDGILRDEVGRIFTCVLENAGVFKRDAEGRAAFQRFAASL